jgi:hypothetical protein
VEIREQDTARIVIKVITNESHPIKSYFMNNKIHDEYATKPRTIIRAIEYLGQLQIDVRRIETTSYYLRPSRGRKTDKAPKGSRSIRFRAEIAKILRKIQRTYKTLHGRL